MVERSGKTIGGSDNFSGGGVGGGVMPLLPDCAAAPAANIEPMRIGKNLLSIESPLGNTGLSAASILL
jgi:hypothetical protein